MSLFEPGHVTKKKRPCKATATRNFVFLGISKASSLWYPIHILFIFYWYPIGIRLISYRYPIALLGIRALRSKAVPIILLVLLNHIAREVGMLLLDLPCGFQALFWGHLRIARFHVSLSLYQRDPN